MRAPAQPAGWAGAIRVAGAPGISAIEAKSIAAPTAKPGQESEPSARAPSTIRSRAVPEAMS